jgi:hypothetical protein
MQIRSMAGEFDVSIERFESEGNDLVMVGKMGVWEARTYITPGELIHTLVKVVSCRALWLYLLWLPVRLIKTSKRNDGNEQ